MARPKYIRRTLDIHPTEWVGGVLVTTPDALSCVLGKGTALAPDWCIDIDCVARVRLHHMARAVTWMGLASGTSLTPHVAQFCDIIGNHSLSDIERAKVRVVDRILAKLRSCGAIAFARIDRGRVWVVTPCEWVEAHE